MRQLNPLLSLYFLGFAVNAFDIGHYKWPGWQLETVLSSPKLSSPQRVISPEFDKFIGNNLEQSKINGLSLAIVRKGGGVTEYGAWGKRTEDGDPMTHTVSDCVVA